MGKMWFGTIQAMQWIDAPLSGAGAGGDSWDTSGELINGGAFSRHAWGSHKQYTFGWSEWSGYKAAQLMKSYRDGSFGRGFIYFIDPNIYEHNILPARWADPSMALGDEGAPLVYQHYPEGVVTSGREANQLPVRSAYYNLDTAPVGYRSDADSLFIPIPQGYTLYLGAMFQAVGTGCVCVAEVDNAGNMGSPIELTPVDNDASNIVPETFNNVAGVRLWVGKSASGGASVSLAAMTARLYPTDRTPPASFSTGPWIGGMGHSGCRFEGVPTFIPFAGVDEGKAEYAATFTEVGDWA